MIVCYNCLDYIGKDVKIIPYEEDDLFCMCTEIRYELYKGYSCQLCDLYIGCPGHGIRSVDTLLSIYQLRKLIIKEIDNRILLLKQ